MLQPLRVFLCHESHDKPAVQELYDNLYAEDWIEPWLDKEKILPGQEWKSVVKKAVDEADVIIVCLSNQAVKKDGYVQWEIRYAYERALNKPEGTIYLIPLQLENCLVPEKLQSFQWVDYFGSEQQKKEAYHHLLLALKVRYSQKMNSELQGEQADYEKFVSLPDETVDLLDSTSTRSRSLGVKDLARFLSDSQLGLTRLAEERLREIAASDGNPGLRETARNILENNGLWRDTAGKEQPQPSQEKAPVVSQPVEQTPKPVEPKPVTPRVEPKKNPAQTVKLKKPEPGTFAIVLGGLAGFLLIVAAVSVTYVGAKWLLATPTPTEAPPVTKEISLPEVTETPTATKAPTETPPLGIGSTMTGADGMTLVYVPAGEFVLGSNEGDPDERPSQTVKLNAFWIDQTEVTNKMYSACVAADVCKQPDRKGSFTHARYYGTIEFENYPVIYVDWNMAKTYCKWAGRDLPSEFQWEKAARGPNANLYPWGNTFDGKRLNFCDVSCSLSWAKKNVNDNYADVSPVASYPSGRSVYGSLDMAGNVWEWTNDWYDVYPGGNVNASEKFGQSYRVLRGGSWRQNMNDIRITNRYWVDPTESVNYFTGFRCALSP